jgi:hypothetical protein
MAALQDIPVSTLSEFLDVTASSIPPQRTPIWFRGVGTASYRLTPSLFRHGTITTIKELIELEYEILTRFKHRSIPFQERVLQTDWEYLFYMQHFGVPTRLLDWSENPFVALYFAITDAELKRDPATKLFTSDAAVWILDPYGWNGHFLGEAWRRIAAVPDAALNSYAPTSDLKTLHTNPVAMAGMHNSRRIVAQRGAFTIFGSNLAPMDQIFVDQSFPVTALKRIVLPKDALESLRNQLFALGYTDSMIYPDLPGLATEIKRQFGFLT